jgi:hypothetical protein
MLTDTITAANKTAAAEDREIVEIFKAKKFLVVGFWKLVVWFGKSSCFRIRLAAVRFDAILPDPDPSPR